MHRRITTYEAGKNWYECKAGCELILDDAISAELVFVVGTGEAQKKVVMGLPGLLRRPNGPTRLSLALACCCAEEMPRCCKRSWIWRNVPSSGKGLGQTGRVVKEAGNERIYILCQTKGGQAVFVESINTIFTHWRSFATFCTTIFIWWILLL